jgi:hypothetical protein
MSLLWPSLFVLFLWVLSAWREYRKRAKRQEVNIPARRGEKDALKRVQQKILRLE